jgi:DNA-binding PadR family transcriptional regulator
MEERATSQRHRSLVEELGFDTSSKDMMVLGALLKAQREPTDFVEFEEIRRQLAIDEGGRKGEDPLIYRSLSSLESQAFIETEYRGSRKGYRSNIAQIQKGLQRALEERNRELVRRIDQIASEVERLESINYLTIADRMISLATGASQSRKPLFAQGWEEVLKMIDDAIYRGLKRGDLVRLTLGWVDRPHDVDVWRIESIAGLMHKGVQFRGLEHRALSGERLEEYREITRSFRSQGHNPGFRVRPRKDGTYQFISRNKEGIVLVVSESPLSATWIPKSANPELVENAISSFDADFGAGVDIEEYRRREESV